MINNAALRLMVMTFAIVSTAELYHSILWRAKVRNISIIHKEKSCYFLLSQNYSFHFSYVTSATDIF